MPNKSVIGTQTPPVASTACTSALHRDRIATNVARCRTSSRSSRVYRWRDPGVRQAPHPQQIGQIGGVTLIIFDAPVRERLDPQRVRQVHRRAELGERIGAVVG